MPEVRIARALNKALADALESDLSVVLFGEDVGRAGGAFTVSRGLQELFPDRVLDTPISEPTIVGAALGAALSGLKPIVEIMFMDFITLAMDQLVNQAAKARFMFGGQTNVPMVLRTPHGGGQSAGPQHSQCLEAWLAHVPGLIVVCPSTVEDSYTLLRAAIDNPNPVVFIENKALYSLKGELPDNPEIAEIGKAKIVRPGRDVTIISYGAMVHQALAAAKLLAKSDIEAEVIDLRTLQPWDKETALSSLSRTHHAVVAHEAVTSFGIGAEIAAVLAHEGFDELDGPVVRVGADFVPIPFAPVLEREVLPNSDDIIAGVYETMNIGV